MPLLVGILQYEDRGTVRHALRALGNICFDNGRWMCPSYPAFLLYAVARAPHFPLYLLGISMWCAVLLGAEERVAEERPGWCFQIFSRACQNFEDQTEFGKWVQDSHIALLS